MVKGWSSTQGTTAMSVAEAEYYALVKGASEGLGLKALAEDLGWSFEITLWTDSSSAKSVASRRGLGKLRHLETKYLWVQEAVKSRRIMLKKVKGITNPSDVATKYLPWSCIEAALGRTSLRICKRRSAERA